MACCSFQRRLLAWASMPRTVALAACRSACAVSTAAFFTATAILIWLLVQFDEKVALVHAVVVVDENPGNLAADAGGDEGHVAVHESVVGRNGVERLPDPGNAEPKGGARTRTPSPPISNLRRFTAWRFPGGVSVEGLAGSVDPTGGDALSAAVSVVSLAMA